MDLFGSRSLPFMVRRNYWYEMEHILAWSVLAGLVEGQFGSVVVAKTFEGSALLISIATATPIAALVFSILWGMLCVGRPKIRFTTLLCLGIVLCTGAVAVIPATPLGGHLVHRADGRRPGAPLRCHHVALRDLAGRTTRMSSVAGSPPACRRYAR